jgi:hypothetical protein
VNGEREVYEPLAAEIRRQHEFNLKATPVHHYVR